MRPGTAALLGLVLSCLAVRGLAAASPQGEIIGRVEIIPGVPVNQCTVLLEGTPLGANCDGSGSFDMKRVPAGRWDLRITANNFTRRVAAGSNPDFVTDLGAIALTSPGSISGRVFGVDASTLAGAVIAVPELGVVTQPNAEGGYLLQGVAPGVRNVVLLIPGQNAYQRNTSVTPNQTTMSINFDLTPRGLKSVAPSPPPQRRLPPDAIR